MADTEAGRGEGRELAEWLDEAAGELEAEVRDRYHADHPDGVHPAQQSKYDYGMRLVKKVREAARRLRQSDPGGEPVAYRVISPDKEEAFGYFTSLDALGPELLDDGCIVQPLYAHPTAPTDEAPEGEPETAYCVTPGCRHPRGHEGDCPVPDDRSPPVEEGERGEPVAYAVQKRLPVGDKVHTAGCVEMHRHSPPGCCSPSCWCQQDDAEWSWQTVGAEVSEEKAEKWAWSDRRRVVPLYTAPDARQGEGDDDG